MKYLIFLVIVLTGCSQTAAEVVVNRVVSRKFCVSECRTHEFRNFHNNGKSWGTGSSSMAGLSQSEIFDRVTKECEEFYKDVDCCSGDIKNNWRNIYTVHSHRYGQCK